MSVVNILGTVDQYGQARVAINGEQHSVPREIIAELTQARQLIAAYEQYVGQSSTAVLTFIKELDAKRKALGVHT